MAGKHIETKASKVPKREIPEIVSGEGKNVVINHRSPEAGQALYGVKTEEAADGILRSALTALGLWGESFRPFMVSLAVELEPRDAAEALLVTQMGATHVAMTSLSMRMLDAPSQEMREGYERSVTRLSRTYLAQMEALKKYRAKAQQTVRVERVNVSDGGQAIIGPVTGARGADDQ